jgi:drug/metabolite transporter (DMT)-like permease
MKKKYAVICAILAAVFYALSTPISKLILVEIPSTILAGLLYLGAGIGMSVVYIIRKKIIKEETEESLNKNDLKYVIGMIVLDILAPILLLLSISLSSPSSVSLLNNFEIVATSLIALFIFKEKIGKKLWLGITFITIASIVLSLDFSDGLSFSWGSLLALGACLCWGMENNCTRSISDKNPYQIVILKGIFSGLGSLIIGLILKEQIGSWIYIVFALILGFVAYGLSVFLYVVAQRYLGAATTSSYYAIAPFIGCGLSFIFFKEIPHFTFFIALLIMIIGVVFVSLDKFKEDIKTEV